MEKKFYILILAVFLISFVLNSCVFAQDNTIDTVLSDDSFSKSFLNKNHGMLLAQNKPAITRDDELDEVFFEDFDDTLESESIFDPLYDFNYLMYSFNDFLYFKAIKPIATGYKTITPVPVRQGVKNFFHNLLFPVRFVNNILQGKIKDSAVEIEIFLINSSFGFLGLSQVAQNRFELRTSNEDLGQTLGSYSIGNGFYLVLPMFGPTTLRDLIGRVGDYFLTPLNYVEPWGLSTGIKAYDTINSASFRLGDYEALKAAALDPYVAIRNAYVQSRKEKIKK
jgi:phospholipid-binding lipoprotein MlaA